MAQTVDLGAALFSARFRRAVDLLWRETVRRRRLRLEGAELARAERRIRNLRRIVRRALADYHRMQSARESDG
ncbi:MAG: hypothetical protein H7X85_09805 [Thermoanaerobaculia bacterium]|nr:hypothetical protein [Thermoanaerobaculia bacterium]